MTVTAQLLEQMRIGDVTARDRLIAHSCERLRRLTRQMLKYFPGVKRWEETGDVLNNSSIRLCDALTNMTPESSRHFYNLAALEIRRELIDLSRRYSGPNGRGTKHHTDGAGKAADDSGGVLYFQAAKSSEPGTSEAWTSFHEAVQALPGEEREVFDLVWYGGLTQIEAAAVLSVSVRTVKRRWLWARVKVASALGYEMPA